MRIKWWQSQTNTSALDDLLRAIEYAEARATIMRETNAVAPAPESGERDHPPPQSTESRHDSWPPYGRGV